MMWIGKAELVGCQCGALGLLTALTKPTPEALVKDIARTRGMTDKPFGVWGSTEYQRLASRTNDHAEGIAAFPERWAPAFHR